MTTDPQTDRLIRAPWTPEQVAALNAFQERGGMHPFTCGREAHGVRLVLLAHRDGWHCSDPACDYRQDWAHAFMAERGRAVTAAAEVSPPPDQTALRARLAGAMAKRDGHPWPTEFEDDERDYYRRADAALGVLPPADRAAVLLGAADHLDARAAAFTAAARKDPLAFVKGGTDARYRTADCWNAAAEELRRLAAEAQQCPGVETVPNRCTCGCDGCKHHCGAHNSAEARPDCTCSHAVDEHSVYGCADGCGCEWMPKCKPMDPVQPAADGSSEEAEAPPVCKGFVWIGQSFATCERCGQPAWEHVGEEVPVEGAGPFDNRRTVRPWAPGQADRIRAKWGTPTKEA